MTLVSSKAHSLPVGRNDFDKQQARLDPAKIDKDEAGKIFVGLPT